MEGYQKVRDVMDKREEREKFRFPARVTVIFLNEISTAVPRHLKAPRSIDGSSNARATSCGV